MELKEHGIRLSDDGRRGSRDSRLFYYLFEYICRFQTRIPIIMCVCVHAGGWLDKDEIYRHIALLRHVESTVL